MGSKGAGKSSVLLTFLERQETPTPTVALEYTFARKSRNMSMKDLTHLWELAGGTRLLNLSTIPISESNIHTCAFILCLDLSMVIPSFEWII